MSTVGSGTPESVKNSVRRVGARAMVFATSPCSQAFFAAATCRTVAASYVRATGRFLASLVTALRGVAFEGRAVRGLFTRRSFFGERRVGGMGTQAL